MKYSNTNEAYEILQPLPPAAILKKVNEDRAQMHAVKPIGQPTKPRNRYSDWCMPPQTAGYIKARNNDCL